MSNYFDLLFYSRDNVAFSFAHPKRGMHGAGNHSVTIDGNGKFSQLSNTNSRSRKWGLKCQRVWRHGPLAACLPGSAISLIRTLVLSLNIILTIGSCGSKLAVGGQPLPLPLLPPPLPSPPFPLLILFFALPLLSSLPFPLPSLQIQLEGLGERCKLPSGSWAEPRSQMHFQYIFLF